MANNLPLRIENRLLASLPDAEHNRLLRYLEPIHFARKRILYEAGQSMRNAYFFRRGMASLLAVAEDGRLGVVYVRAGMIAEAEREFQTLVRQNHGSPLAKKLLNEVQSWQKR